MGILRSIIALAFWLLLVNHCFFIRSAEALALFEKSTSCHETDTPSKSEKKQCKSEGFCQTVISTNSITFNEAQDVSIPKLDIGKITLSKLPEVYINHLSYTSLSPPQQYVLFISSLLTAPNAPPFK